MRALASVFAAVIASCSAAREPAGTQAPATARTEPAEPAAREPAVVRPTELVARWTVDIDAHARRFEADPSTKWTFVMLTRTRPVLELTADGSFSLSASSAGRSAAFAGTWTVERNDARDYWLLVHSDRGDARMRLVLDEHDRLEYFDPVDFETGVPEAIATWVPAKGTFDPAAFDRGILFTRAPH